MSATATIKKVGGSMMFSIPPAYLKQMHLHEGSLVGLDLEGEKLVVSKAIPKKKRYNLGDLLAQCEAQASINPQETEWMDNAPQGKEEF